MDHNHNTEGTGGKSPRRLPRNLTLTLGILVGNVKHLAKVLPEVVAGGALNGPSRHGNVGFDGGGLMSAGKLLLLGLEPRNDGDGQAGPRTLGGTGREPA